MTVGLLLATAGGLARADGFPWKTHAAQADAWYRSAEGRGVADNVLSHQSAHGSWPKNLDTGANPYRDDPQKLRGTFDNGATRGEMRFLARAYRATNDPRCREAFLKALDAILRAQYASGGWPQSYPPGSGYARHITFNDGTMVGLMTLLGEVADSPEYAWVDAARREKAKAAFDRGVDCIVKCQIVVDGRPTVWCAQHDAVTLEPRGARTYEHPSLSGSESAEVVLLLMGLKGPSREVLRAVDAACRWFDRAKLTGIRQVTRDGDKVIVADPQAPPLWARFYEIGTNRPMFSGRDGVIKFNLAEIERERRTGYAWYGAWGQAVLERWPKWKKQHGL